MGNKYDSPSVDSDVAQVAKSIQSHARDALHRDGEEQITAQNALQEEWQQAQQHGAGFVRAVAQQIQKDNSGIGSMNVRIDVDAGSLSFAPSAFDFSEKQSSVKANLRNTTKATAEIFGGTAFNGSDVNDKVHYLNRVNREHAPYYNPLRPAGIGELNPGAETDGCISSNGGKVDRRSSKTIHNEDGSTTYLYEGRTGAGTYEQMNELRESWGLDPKTSNDAASPFRASETIAADGKTLLSMNIRYDKPKTLMIDAQNGINQRGITCDAVSEIIGKRRSDGDYQAQIQMADGSRMYCLTNESGRVVMTQTFPPAEYRKSNTDPSFWWNKEHSDFWEK